MRAVTTDNNEITEKKLRPASAAIELFQSNGIAKCVYRRKMEK